MIQEELNHSAVPFAFSEKSENKFEQKILGAGNDEIEQEGKVITPKKIVLGNNEKVQDPVDVIIM